MGRTGVLALLDAGLDPTRAREVGMSRRSLLVMSVVVSMFFVGGPPVSPHPLSEAPRCRVFPSDNHWNLPVDDLPVHDNSGALVRSKIGRASCRERGPSSADA